MQYEAEVSEPHMSLRLIWIDSLVAFFKCHERNLPDFASLGAI